MLYDWEIFASKVSHEQMDYIPHCRIGIITPYAPAKRSKNRLSQIMIKKSEKGDAYSFLQEHIYLVAKLFMGEKIRVYDYGEQSLQLANYQTDVTALLVYFTVDFKEEFVTLVFLGR